MVLKALLCLGELSNQDDEGYTLFVALQGEIREQVQDLVQFLSGLPFPLQFPPYNILPFLANLLFQAIKMPVEVARAQISHFAI